MQVLAVTTWFPTEKSPGAGSFIARDVVALARDHDVRVLHLAPPELDDGVSWLSCGDAPVQRVPVDVRTPKGLLSSRKIVRRALGGTEVLHTMAAPALLPFLPRRPSVPWVHTEHWSGVANLSRSRRASKLLPLSRRAFNGPDEVVAVSHYLAHEVGRLRRGPVRVVGNIVDVPDSASVVTPPAGDGRLRLLGVGNVNAHKGWALALEALELLNGQGVDVELTWLGSGPDLRAMRARGAALPFFAPGQVSADVVRRTMLRSNVLLMPTVSETFSLVTIEALACGLPAVVTGVGGHIDFISPGAGLVVDRTPAAIAAGALEAAGHDREVVKKVGRGLTEIYSETRFREQYSAIYRKVSR